MFKLFVFLYLQFMFNLPKNHPELYDMFMNRFHIIRQSDRYRAGVSSDMIMYLTTVMKNLIISVQFLHHQ